MAYSEKLADRVREAFVNENNVEEKKMFGGLCFLLNDKMCVCVGPDRIMCRLDPENYEKALEQPGIRQMIHGGKVKKGYVYVEENQIATNKELHKWVELAVSFNDQAEASPKRKKSIK